MSVCKPNIVLIMTDQQRASFCRREGYSLDTTPFLDRLAGGGVWFDHAYTSAPACVPARISALTGRWPQATGIRHNSFRLDMLDCMPRFDKDLFHVMSQAGYRTALCGKNHSHIRPGRVDYWSEYSHSAGAGRRDRSSNEIAFDQYLEGLHHRADFEPAPFPLSCQAPFRIVRDAINWVDAARESPFFLWLSFPEPHNPYQVPEPYFNLFPPATLPALQSESDEWRRRGFKWEFTRWIGEQAFSDYEPQLQRARSNYHGMLRLIDDQIRRFVEYLQDCGQFENTIVVFISDHGDFAGEYGLVRKGPEMPDCLMRIPMIWTGPSIERRNGPHPAHVSIVDVMPTLCEAVGQDLPSGVQGRSLWPMLTGRQWPEEEFSSVYGEQGMGGLHYSDAQEVLDPTEDGLEPGVAFDELNSRTQSGTMRTLRRGKWKLDFDMQMHGQLYDLENDPVELVNLYGSPDTKDIERELLAELLAWSLRAQDPLPLPNLRYKPKFDKHNYWSPHR